jgi:hypothetical protein
MAKRPAVQKPPLDFGGESPGQRLARLRKRAGLALGVSLDELLHPSPADASLYEQRAPLTTIDKLPAAAHAG